MKPQSKRWYIRWWAWCMWITFGVILTAIGIGLWAWTQRYSLLESRAVNILAEAGFDADLKIVSITSTQAQVKDLRLSRDGENIVMIESAEANYIWPDVRDLQFKSIDVNGATGWLSLGEDWLPTQNWINEALQKETKGNSSPSFTFPEKGVNLMDSKLILESPLGQSTLFIDAEGSAADAFTANITLSSSDLSYGGYTAVGAGVASLEKSGPKLRIIAQTQTETLSNGKLDVSNAHLQINGTFDLDNMDYDGSASLESESLSSELYAAEAVSLGWDGHISPTDGMKALGTWIISAKSARSPNPERAKDVAETLSLYPAMRVVPVTEHYASQMRDTVLDFLNQSDISGQGRLEYSPAGFTIDPIGTFNVKTGRNELRLRPRPDQTFYEFVKSTGTISTHLDAVFEMPVGLTLNNVSLNASSQNGIRLEGVSSFETELKTQGDWTATDSSERPVRLSPLEATLEYDAAVTPRRLSVMSAFNYDGELPGSYVEGLDLDGRLDVRLYDGRQVLDFTPRPKSIVTLKSLETPTNWQGQNIQFTLPPTTNLFSRTSKQSTFSAKIKDAKFTLSQDALAGGKPQIVNLRAEAMDMRGTLFPNATQDWKIDFTNSEYNSDTLPGPETMAMVQTGHLTARLTPEKAPQITLSSPSVTVETPAYRLSDFQIDMGGTPEKYDIEHTDGMVFILGSELAEAAKSAGLGHFPANGSIKFSDGKFNGQTSLRVEKANDAIVNVSYTFSDGKGTADIQVPSILFEPQGLQPQNLVPAFRGKIARVEGEAQANLKIAFADGTLTESRGTVDLIDIAVGTAPGPITGLNTKVGFASLWPLETNGQQMLTMESFNPGFPLENGVVTYNFVPEGVQIDAADWPIGNGAFSLDPFTWVYAADENRVTMRVKNVALGDFLDNFGNKKISATGNVIGTFPVVVRGIDVLIEDGKISVPDGGEIKYDPGPTAQTYSEADAISILRERRSNEYAALAQDALREFKYRELSASLDGPINGDVEIGLVFDGSNKQVLNQQPFRFDISVKGELFNIARSFDSNAQVKSEIIRQSGQLPEGTTLGK